MLDLRGVVRYRLIMLGIKKETLRQWDEELLEDLFGQLRTGHERAWATHGNIIKVISRGNCNVRANLGRLLDVMEHMDSLEPGDLALVIENMDGRTASKKDGGAYLFRSCPELADRMESIMERLRAVL